MPSEDLRCAKRETPAPAFLGVYTKLTQHHALTRAQRAMETPISNASRQLQRRTTKEA